MKKMLVADNIEMNKSILNEIFGSAYEIIQTNSSEVAFRFLTSYKSEIAIVLMNENIAQNLSAEHVETLSGLKIFENVPIILIMNSDNTKRRALNVALPYSDVVNSPVNPYIIQKRVANLAELYSHKNELEELVEKQTEKIVAQNQALRLQQRKINNINNDMLDTLSTVIEYRDVESGKHIHRIKKFTEVMLRALSDKYPAYRMTEEKINLIASASSLHDIGKIAIPDSILLSPKRLSREEFEVMKLHTVKGCELLDQLDTVEKNEYFTYCYDIVRYHHEKYDGKGYPDGLKGENIPIWAQVVSVADCYDALTSDRPYKSAFSHEQAVEMIRGGACGTFSPVIMDCFGSVLNEFKKLAEEYADVNHIDSSVSSDDERMVHIDPDADNSDDIYRKMDRGDLIRTIELQKQEMKDAKRKDTDVLLKMADFVLEFDLERDSCIMRKGSCMDLLGYDPKNYAETIMLLSGICPDEYRSKFIRAFRMDSIAEESLKGTERIVLECPMNVGDAVHSFRCTVVPIRSDGKLKRAFFSLEQLTSDPTGGIYSAEGIDSMTGLWNFSGLRSEIEDFLSHSGANGQHILALIDVDGFRAINRRTGYRFGNEILKDIADLLREQFSEKCISGRVEDDNFILFVQDCPGKEENLALIDNIFRRLHKTYTFDGITYPEISACIGVASYPGHGRSFDELFSNASKAVDIAKINGKNMYLFYNENMRTSWELATSQTDLSDNDKTVYGFERFFVPMTSSVGEGITGYEMIENTSDYDGEYNFDDIYSAIYFNSNITAISLNSIRRMFATIYSLQQEGYRLPRLTITTMFRSSDSEIAARAIREFLTYYPISTKNICINITQDMLSSGDMGALAEFADTVRGFGFELGVYNVGLNAINNKCFTAGLFSRITFANSFIDDVAGGIIPQEALISLMECFAGLGAVPYLPMNADKGVIEELMNKCGVCFGLFGDKMISEEQFRSELSAEDTMPAYPALEHEKNSLVLSDRLYEEILEQTNSFIFEWIPRTDAVKFSASFEKMYGYMPARYDFLKNIRQISFVHKDDLKKFLDTLNSARGEGDDAECVVRIYNDRTSSYIWNRIHFVTMCSPTGVPAKIMAVCADISEEKVTNAELETKKDRTDNVTNFYNRAATENKIKSFLFDEGAMGNHAFIVAEVCGYESLESSLGEVFANAVLKETADSMREFFRDSDIIGRVSGAQFVILVKGMSSVERLMDKTKKICTVIDHTYRSDEGSVSIRGKVGVSLYPNDGRTFDELFSSASNALYYAKHSVGSNAAFSVDYKTTKRLMEKASV